jgi:anti-sigma factor RsiW
MHCKRLPDETLAGQKMEFLYGEADAEARARVEAHLAECAPCREEMASLGRLRRDLRAWTLEERPPVSVRLAFFRPAWIAAAAALLFGIGVGLALFGFVSVRSDLAAQEARALQQERRHQQEIAALRAALEGRRNLPVDAETAFARVDEHVSERIRQSERRQRELLEATFTDWSGEIEARRRMDLARVAAGLSYLDGRHGQQLARTNELMGYVLEAASQEK